jgi:photosynthetic reaction center cytochrome c subunit
MTRWRNLRVSLGLCILVLIAGCEKGLVETKQIGYRGVAMEQVTNPYDISAEKPENLMPPAAMPVAPPGGPLAADVYQNVQVLKDLNITQFTRLMLNMVTWVSPEQGCNYCHEEGNLASDKLYTKQVARRMLEMTRHINDKWESHVSTTGVTCYTCHRGNNVPLQVLTDDVGNAKLAQFAGNRDAQNKPSAMNGFTSLPNDGLLASALSIRVTGDTALPIKGGARSSIRETESTFGLMTHFSKSLGVNCTFCHNSRAFADWSQSPVQRTTAWHAIQMARDLNADYLLPLRDKLPETRLGPAGDAPKVGCATCHNGQNKPLAGVAVLKDHPELKSQPKP